MTFNYILYSFGFSILKALCFKKIQKLVEVTEEFLNILACGTYSRDKKGGPQKRYIALLNKPYVNEVTLTGQKPPYKCC